MIYLAKVATSSAAPVARPVVPEPTAAAPVAAAIAQIGQALIALAAAMESKPAVLRPVASTLTPSPMAATGAGMTVSEVINEFLRAKARAGRSDRYLRQLRVSLKSFAAGRYQTPAEAVAAAAVERWLYSSGWAPKTCRGYLADVKGLFSFAVRRGWVAVNPAAAVELPSAATAPAVEVYTPEAAAAIMAAARTCGADVCRHWAVRLFAGVRTAEAHRLREADVKAGAGFIEVPAAKSKTRSRRLVTIQPNLAAWLALGGELRPIGVSAVRAALKASGVAPVRNGARHSFVSYHLAAFGSAAKTAIEAGHSEAMLFANYRAVVSPAAAAAFWGIVPA